MGELYTGSNTIGEDHRFNKLVGVCLGILDAGEDVGAAMSATKASALDMYDDDKRLASTMVTAVLSAALEVQAIIVPDDPREVACE